MERAGQPTGEQFDQYRRLYNDTATWLAEVLDGSMLTSFEYSFDGRELYADDGSPLSDIFLDSLNDAQRVVDEKPELSFEYRRRKAELDEYRDMLRMARGELPNTMIVVSDFPAELMGATRDVGGYNVTRKQTMLRVLSWDGKKMRICSQSLDGSNRCALESIYDRFGSKAVPGELLSQRIHANLDVEAQQYLVGQLTNVYDHSLTEQYPGVQWHAGRAEAPKDTYKFVLGQDQLIDYFIREHMHRAPTDSERYDLSALVSKRYKRWNSQEAIVVSKDIIFDGLFTQDLERQLRLAGNEARSERKVFSGCGMSVGGGREGLPPTEQLEAAGYGNRSYVDEDKLGSRTFTCPNGHTNYRRVANVLERSCTTCSAGVGCEVPKDKSSSNKWLGKSALFSVQGKNPTKVLVGVSR